MVPPTCSSSARIGSMSASAMAGAMTRLKTSSKSVSCPLASVFRPNGMRMKQSGFIEGSALYGCGEISRCSKPHPARSKWNKPAELPLIPRSSVCTDPFSVRHEMLQLDLLFRRHAGDVVNHWDDAGIIHATVAFEVLATDVQAEILGQPFAFELHVVTQEAEQFAAGRAIPLEFADLGIDLPGLRAFA